MHITTFTLSIDICCQVYEPVSILVLRYFLQTFIVAGGLNDNWLSSTEVLRAGATEWTTGGALPSARYGLKGVTILNQFYVTGECWAVMMYLVSVVPLIIFPGGSDYPDTLSDVLRYEPESKEWTKTADLATPRSNHAVSTVDMDTIDELCSTVESGTRMSPNNPDKSPNNDDEVTHSTFIYIN